MVPIAINLWCAINWTLPDTISVIEFCVFNKFRHNFDENFKITIYDCAVYVSVNDSIRTEKSRKTTKTEATFKVVSIAFDDAGAICAISLFQLRGELNVCITNKELLCDVLIVFVKILN